MQAHAVAVREILDAADAAEGQDAVLPACLVRDADPLLVHGAVDVLEQA